MSTVQDLMENYIEFKLNEPTMHQYKNGPGPIVERFENGIINTKQYDHHGFQSIGVLALT